MLAVRYCVCTALDEAANNTVWGRRGVWAGKSLLVTFHGESEGGIKLFQIIGRLAASFREHSDVLEIIYHILGLGFEGRYSVRPDGRKQLDDIRQQLLTQLVQRRDPITPTLAGFCRCRQWANAADAPGAGLAERRNRPAGDADAVWPLQPPDEPRHRNRTTAYRRHW